MLPMATDPVWEKKYSAGYAARYPWDSVVSFVLCNAPTDRPRDQIVVCEVGFGTANNLLFAAQEGFAVCGIEGSKAAVEKARAIFASLGENVKFDLREGDFTQPLPFQDTSIDLMIDRGPLPTLV